LKPVSWLSIEETKPHTAKANNTGIKWQQNTKANLNQRRPKPAVNFKNSSCVRIIVHSCCTQYSTEQFW